MRGKGKREREREDTFVGRAERRINAFGIEEETRLPCFEAWRKRLGGVSTRMNTKMFLQRNLIIPIYNNI